MAIDDILEALRREEIDLEYAVEKLRQRIGGEASGADLQALRDAVDRSEQAGLPADHAGKVRECLNEVLGGGGDEGANDSASSDDDDVLELTLEPAEEPKQPPSGRDITDGPEVEPPPETESDEPADAAEPPAEDTPDQATGDEEAPEEDPGGLPSIHQDEQQPSDEYEGAEDAAMDEDGPPASGGSSYAPDQGRGADLNSVIGRGSEDDEAAREREAERHRVTMETRGSLPSSQEEGHYPDEEPEGFSSTTMIGALLGSRFELLTRIGQDPYGTVYRARDHEVEGSDPEKQLCGVRLLPASLAKQDAVMRRVAAVVKRLKKVTSPQILTTHGLFREGDQAWIVTELPPGTTLARFIRRECVKGLPVERSMAIVNQIGQALAAAHKAGMPHGDLKPASIFIGSDDSIRVADFGLRPSLFGKRLPSGQAGSTEIEQMDPIDAYLTAEAMEGEPPEPSDDIYSLACITATLLTGGHPFDGKSGLRRVEANTPMPRIRSLTRHQNRVLNRALAIWRSDRPDSVSEFLDDLATRRGRLPKLPLVIGAGLVAAAIAAWFPVQQWLAERELDATVASLEDLGWPAVRGELRTLAPETRDAVLDDLKDRLVADYAGAIEERLEESNVPEAENLLDEARRYYPDSERLNRLGNQVALTRESLLQETESDLLSRLAANELGPREDGTGIPTLVERLRGLDPDHPAVDLDDLRARYHQTAEQAADAADLDRIHGLIAAARTLFPEDDRIHETLDAALSETENTVARQAAADLAPRLRERLPADDLETVRAVRADWIELLKLTGGHEVLDRHQEQVAERLDEQLTTLIAAGEWKEANVFLRETAPLWPTDRLEDSRQRLTRATLDNDARPISLSEVRRALSERQERVRALLESPRLTPVWSGELIIAWREMLAWMRPGRSWLPELRQRVETVHLEAAETARENGDPDRARRLLSSGLAILPNSRALQSALEES